MYFTCLYKTEWEKKKKATVCFLKQSPDDITSNAFNKENKYPAMADARGKK